MDVLKRLIYDFDRLAYHYNVVTLYGLFFQRVLPLISLACIVLGLLIAGYALPDPSGSQFRALRRVALAGALSIIGIGVYIVVPIWLDSLGITPAPGHLRFYGMFFLPVGALAGVLAVVVGSSRHFAAGADKPGRTPFWLVGYGLVGYGLGFVVLWLSFLLYSRLILGVTMIAVFALPRATVTAALGAVIFGFAPYLVRVVDRRPARWVLSWGYGLLVAGTISLLLAQVVTQVLSLRGDVL